ncbi:MAG: glycosyltransferase [Lachnospiraceae bacterium]|nr:glycosyltransferase [Lachnospiraceae bacterium]
MKPLVSIIVPVYNAVKYVEKMICSILAQTYDNFELLLIIDGATDGSYEICKKYAASEIRIVMFNQANKGICAARNKGIVEARGKYILFVDHDDEISPTLIERAVVSIEETGADLVKFGFTICNTDKKNRCCKKVQIYRNITYDKEGLCNDYMYILNSEANVYIWDALYRSDFIKQNVLCFDEKYSNGGEDIAFNISMLPYIKKIGFISDNLYNHYNRDNQSTSLKFSENMFKAKIQMLDDVLKTYEVCFSDRKYPVYYAYFASKVIGSICSKGFCMDRTKLSIEYLAIAREHIEWDTIKKTIIKSELSYKRRIVLIMNVMGMNRMLSICFSVKQICLFISQLKNRCGKK